MARRRLVITLTADAYRRLADIAEAEERVVDQQASLMLKRLLTAVPAVDELADHLESVGSQATSHPHAIDERGADCPSPEAAS